MLVFALYNESRHSLYCVAQWEIFKINTTKLFVKELCSNVVFH